eukprot:scaffold1017_cov374-Prasinococcus_capsulatus_cf.AAC.10
MFLGPVIRLQEATKNDHRAARAEGAGVGVVVAVVAVAAGAGAGAGAEGGTVDPGQGEGTDNGVPTINAMRIPICPHYGAKREVGTLSMAEVPRTPQDPPQMIEQGPVEGIQAGSLGPMLPPANGTSQRTRTA